MSLRTWTCAHTAPVSKGAVTVSDFRAYVVRLDALDVADSDGEIKVTAQGQQQC